MVASVLLALAPLQLLFDGLALYDLMQAQQPTEMDWQVSLSRPHNSTKNFTVVLMCMQQQWTVAAGA